MPRSERAPSFQFYPMDWLSDPAVDALSFDEQGRYFRALCMTYQGSAPGIATEDQWRAWMRYTEEEWPAHREALARCFKVDANGAWIQKRTRNDSRAQRRRYRSAKEAGRRSGVARRAKASNGSRTERERIGNEKPTPSSSASASASSSERNELPHPTPPERWRRSAPPVLSEN